MKGGVEDATQGEDGNRAGRREVTRRKPTAHPRKCPLVRDSSLGEGTTTEEEEGGLSQGAVPQVPPETAGVKTGKVM